MATTHSGVDTNNSASFETSNDAADAFLSRWLDAGQLSKDEDEAPTPRKKVRETDLEEDNSGDVEDNESDDEELDLDEGDDADQSEDSDEDSDEDDSDEKVAEATDDAVVKIKVGDEERTVSVKDLKRLYGQEASLTRKSQEVAEAKKKAEEDGARYTVAVDTLLQKANARFAPYANIDWLVAQTQLEPEEFAALRQEARAAYEDVQFLTSEVDNTFKAIESQRQAVLKEEAKKAIEYLSDEKTGIPGWSQKLYDDIRAYAVKENMQAEVVDSLIDPHALKLIYKAMKYDAAVAKAKTTKKSAPKKVVKTSAKASQVLGKKPTAQDEMKRLNKSGSTDDAVNVFLARWNAMDSDD